MCSSTSSDPSGSIDDVDVRLGSENDFAWRRRREQREGGYEARTSRDGCEPQNWTCGASRAAGSSISKYWRSSKLKTPATMFVGTVSSAVSYVRTASL